MSRPGLQRSLQISDCKVEGSVPALPTHVSKCLWARRLNPHSSRWLQVGALHERRAPISVLMGLFLIERIIIPLWD